MKFNISFKVHGKIFANQGTRKIVDVPGIIRFSTYDMALKIVLDYKSEKGVSLLVPGIYLIYNNWNNINFSGDGTNMVLNVNNNIFTLDTVHRITRCVVSNFSASNYIKFDMSPFLDAVTSPDSWEMKYSFLCYDPTPSGNNQYQMVVGPSGTSSAGELIHQSVNGSLFYWSWYSGDSTIQNSYFNDFTVQANTRYDITMAFTGAQYKIIGYIGDTRVLNYSFNSTTKMYISRYAQATHASNLGYSYNANRGYYGKALNGEIYFDAFKFTINGSAYIDYKNGIGRDKISFVGSPTIDMDTEWLWPYLTVGQISLCNNGWETVRDLTAARVNE